MKLWKMILYGLGALPWIFVISLWAFYYHAAKLLGYYPTSGHPGSMNFHYDDIYCRLMNYSSITWAVSTPLFALLTLISFILKKTNYYTFIAITIYGHLLAIVLAGSTTIGWYFDWTN